MSDIELDVMPVVITDRVPGTEQQSYPPPSGSSSSIAPAIGAVALAAALIVITIYAAPTVRRASLAGHRSKRKRKS